MSVKNYCLLVTDPFWREWLGVGAIIFAVASFLVLLWPLVMWVKKRITFDAPVAMPESRAFPYGLHEIEVTPEMIEAGTAILWDSGLTEDHLEADKLVVCEIYRAMHRLGSAEHRAASRRAPAHRPKKR